MISRSAIKKRPYNHRGDEVAAVRQEADDFRGTFRQQQYLSWDASAMDVATKSQAEIMMAGVGCQAGLACWLAMASRGLPFLSWQPLYFVAGAADKGKAGQAGQAAQLGQAGQAW